MYLSKINYQNVGPLKNIEIDFPFNASYPQPVILVGENGAGKSLLVSNIIDAMYEIGGRIYENVLESQNGNGHFYYKISQGLEIQIGQQYSSSYIKFTNGKESIEYLTKTGLKNFEEWKKETQIHDISISWGKDDNNEKILTQDEKILSLLFDNNICCYFSPNRYSKPFWLSEHYFALPFHKENQGFNIKHKFSRKLYNPITVENSITDNISWLLDIILDSRIDIDENYTINPQTKQLDKRYSIPHHTNQNDLSLLKIARNNIEIILSEILGQQVFLRAKYRNSGPERIYVVDKQENIILKSLEALSTGQMALFNIFSNIVRYADSIDLNKSIKLGEIKGIVIIDEAELHLHSKLQYTTLPKLMRKFPKVQFVITTHSPLYILGMEKVYGERNFQIRELPQNEVISTEEFSQFAVAYEMLKETQKYRDEISAIKRLSESQKALVITEGTSDWIHIKNALLKLKNNSNLTEDIRNILNDIDIDFLEYYPKQSNQGSYQKLDMGDSALIQLCEQLSKLPQPKKYIFIADRDKESTIKKLSTDNQPYKDWGNNVYSFCIPFPKKHSTINDLCIEHYYTKKELTTKILCEDNITRRIYLGSEFNSQGISEKSNRKCENLGLCGENKKTILDGSEHKKIYVNDIAKITKNEQKENITQETNLGLSKIKFAEAVSNNEKCKNFNLQNFIDIFVILDKIMNS